VRQLWGWVAAVHESVAHVGETLLRGLHWPPPRHPRDERASMSTGPQVTIRWSIVRRCWQVWQGSTCLAHSSSLDVLQRRWPRAIIALPEKPEQP
jgi:hypothetical protein